MLEVTYCELCPVRVAQLLHRSGRLLLQGKCLHQLAGLYGDKLVVDGDTPPNFTFPAAQLLDTTGRVLLTQTVESVPHPLGTLVPLGAGTNLWRVTYWNENGYAGTRDDSYHLMRPNGQLVAPEVRFFSVWAVDAQRAAGMGHRAGQSGVLAVATGEWLLRAPVVAPGVGPTLVVGQQNRLGAIWADGRPLLPIQYDMLDACHTRSGQPLPYWFAKAGQQSWLLAPDGQPVLDLHGYWLVGGTFDDNLTYDAVNWSTTQEALIRLDTTRSTAPRPASRYGPIYPASSPAATAPASASLGPHCWLRLAAYLIRIAKGAPISSALPRHPHANGLCSSPVS